VIPVRSYERLFHTSLVEIKCVRVAFLRTSGSGIVESITSELVTEMQRSGHGPCNMTLSPGKSSVYKSGARKTCALVREA
jgi:hypothetical protein